MSSRARRPNRVWVSNRPSWVMSSPVSSMSDPHPLGENAQPSLAGAEGVLDGAGEGGGHRVGEALVEFAAGADAQGQPGQEDPAERRPAQDPRRGGKRLAR